MRARFFGKQREKNITAEQLAAGKPLFSGSNYLLFLGVLRNSAHWIGLKPTDEKPFARLVPEKSQGSENVTASCRCWLTRELRWTKGHRLATKL